MDPRLKLRYYEDNGWESFYVTEAKDTVSQVWENNYKRIDSDVEQEPEIEDELFSHFFKKRKVCDKDELSEYLKESAVPHTTDVLQWWKVCLL